MPGTVLRTENAAVNKKKPLYFHGIYILVGEGGNRTEGGGRTGEGGERQHISSRTAHRVV